MIEMSGRQLMKYTLLAACGEGLVVVKPTDKRPGWTVTDALIAVGAAWPYVLAGGPFTTGDVEIKSGGVYTGGKRLTDFAAVVERIDRAAVTEVRGPHTKSAGDPSANVVKERAIRGTEGLCPAARRGPWERLRLALPPSLQGAGTARKSDANVRPSPAPSAGAKGFRRAVRL
jgi:hypothetical protein